LASGRQLNASSLASAIRTLLDDEATLRRCLALRDELARTDPVAEVCTSIESLLGEDRLPLITNIPPRTETQ
jgi:UDP:flavonoid glycosyltransferase YjiC (YdhE family)